MKTGNFKIFFISLAKITYVVFAFPESPNFRQIYASTDDYREQSFRLSAKKMAKPPSQIRCLWAEPIK
jgi:hypothetical protein